MRRLAQQAALHFGARLASVGLSFLLFAWIGKVLDPAAAVAAYAFTFSLGFGLATARMVLQLGAGIDGGARMTQRLRQAMKGMALLRRLLPLLMFGIGAATWANTHSSLLTISAASVALLAAADIDLLRGAAGRASLFSAAFAVGGALAMLLLVFVLPHTLTGVVIALLSQWLPVCFINLPMLKRLLRKTKGETPALANNVGTLLLAGFDGLVLNAPYLGLFMLPLTVSLELSLVTRIFVASLPMLPLLLHWSNSPAFGQACKRMGISEHAGFMVGLLISGALAGSVFIGAFILIARKPVSVSTIVLYLVLLLGYAVFAPQMRFASARWTKSALLMPLATSLLAFLVLVGLLAATHFPLGASAVVVIQMLTLVTTARWLSRHKPVPEAARPSPPDLEE